MNCDDIRKLISDDVDGAASAEDAQRVREHLAVCPECRAVRRQWERIDSIVKRGPADTPSEEYWDEFPNRLEARLRMRPLRLRLFANVHSWGWAAAAVLLVAFCGALYVAAYQSRRASQADDRLVRLATRPVAEPAVPVLPVSNGVGTPTDLKLFHELDLTFEGGVKWVATDGQKIDFGVTRELGVQPATDEGPDRVAAVALTVRRVDGERGRLADRVHIMGRSGCRADFTTQAGGLEFNYTCLPLIRSETAARLHVSVGVGKPEGDGYGATTATLDLHSGQSAEVGRVVSDGVTYAIEVSLSMMPLKVKAGPRGA